ncbi:protein TIFY 9-like isoform X2 [Zingiber officinale]|uniref:protein TIFY 9-like isoform X2 n=1 Tax=Zingiber officinale TaxID=94328 RepID=UPI001C4D3937|nr:protein TIFY 9-like isoform X2 [Zingiber officinale]
MAEHDFFQIEKQNAARYGVVDGRSSARGIQSVVSRINPQLLRSVIAPGPASMWPANAALLLSSSSPPPVTAPNPSVRSVTEISKETMPLTIFYRGTVAVFDLPRDKTEAILKLAETANADNVIGGTEGMSLPEDLLPMSRRKSLRRFLAKRKQRLTESGPYVKVKEVEDSGKIRFRSSQAGVACCSLRPESRLGGQG